MGNTKWTDITRKDQYRAVSELVMESHGRNSYYPLLILSSVVISAGLLLTNSAILIGGMLITPVLTPILLIALGVVASKPRVIKQTVKLILKSIGLIFVVAFLASLIFGVPEDTEFFSSTLLNDTIKSAFLYFLVAFASGIAATFAWIRKEVSNALPGISIAVSLVPPIALIGIWLAQMDIATARFFLMIFLFNLVGLIMSSMIVFSILGFHKTADEITHNMKTSQNGKVHETDSTQKKI